MGLTKEGIAAQIIASIQTWKDGFGSESDCELTVANLVRNYCKPSNNDRCQFTSKSVNGHPRKGVKDHLVPVEVITEKLMGNGNLSLTMQDIKQVADFLDQTVVLVRISKEEEKRLKSVPPPQTLADTEDIWYRYKSAGIYDNILQD